MSEQPTITNKAILTKPKRKIIHRIAEWCLQKELITGMELKRKSPILLHLQDDFKVKTIKNVKPGSLQLKNCEGEKLPFKTQILSKKLLMWEYGEEEIPLFITSDKELFNLPNEPQADAEAINMLLMRLKANDQLLEEKLGFLGSVSKKQVMNILYLIGGVVGIAVAFLFAWKTFDLGVVFGVGEASTEVVKQAVQQPVTNIVEQAGNNGSVIL